MDINVIDIKDLEDLEVSETYQKLNRPQSRVNPFHLTDGDFRKKYRFTKTFASKIVDLLREDLVHNPRGQTLSPELQVVCALRNWARHEIQDDTADLHGVSQPTISKTCKKIAGLLAGLSHGFIKMPATLNQQEEAMRKKVIGAIDCTD